MSATVFTVETLGLAASSGPSELLLLGFGSGSAFPPVAGFTGTPLTGFAPLTVFFTDTSTGTITSEQFDPGDSSGILTSVPASHVYVSVGTYSPSLLVIGPGGSDTLTRTGYITVSPPPPPPPTPSGLVCGAAEVLAVVEGFAGVFAKVAGTSAVVAAVEGSAIIPEC